MPKGTSMQREKMVKALYLEIHEAIEEAASSLLETMEQTEISYPPGLELTDKEKSALNQLSLTNEAKSGLRKLVLDACAYPSFHLFSLLDGVADPKSELAGEWAGMTLVERTDDHENMMHDVFKESYWEFKEQSSKIDL